MVADDLVLVPTLQGYAGVGGILDLVRNHFDWPSVTRNTRQYVLSCGCRRRKRQNIRRLVMLPGRPPETWNQLQIDIVKSETPSLSGNKYVILVVDRASRVTFGSRW